MTLIRRPGETMSCKLQDSVFTLSSKRLSRNGYRSLSLSTCTHSSLDFSKSYPIPPVFLSVSIVTCNLDFDLLEYLDTESWHTTSTSTWYKAIFSFSIPSSINIYLVPIINILLIPILGCHFDVPHLIATAPQLDTAPSRPWETSMSTLGTSSYFGIT